MTAQTAEVASGTESDLTAVEVRIPQFRRDISPLGIALSAKDLNEFSELVMEANERAKKIEYTNLDLANFESPEQAQQRLNDFMPLEYSYTAKNGDYITGLGIPKTDDRSFPEELSSFFVSNTAYGKRAINFVPLNAIDAYFGFEKPSLKIDLQTLPSNPTENKSVINIYGRDEDWVLSTAERINDFLKRRKMIQPSIHGSGAYDYLLYIVFLPFIIWLCYKYADKILPTSINDQSVFFNVILAIYVFLLAAMMARFLFQYVRWLFPPIEYYKKSRVGAYVHRSIAVVIGLGILSSALYDIGKNAATSLFAN